MSTKTVGNYTLVEKLGQGSYATVYKAHHKTNGGNFAVKVISREKIGSTKLQANLEQEISIMKEITHENVVRLFGTFTSKNNIYLVLEFCGGGDLQLFIRKHKRLEEPVARRFLIQLARGLHFLHSKNIIHRDIKPQNLLLSEFSPNAVIKFADFGFAKHLHEASMAQTPCGTPLYMAPEIFEMKEYDAKADVWSVGCVLFEMCTGEPPFKGSNHRELFMNIRSKSLRLPSSVTLSPEVTEILQRLLELNPQRRVSLDMLYRVTERMSTMAADQQNEQNLQQQQDTPLEAGTSTTGQQNQQVQQDQVKQNQQDDSSSQNNSSKNPDITETVSGSAFSSSRSPSTAPNANTSNTHTHASGNNEGPNQSGSESSGSGGSGGGSGGGGRRRKSSGDVTTPVNSPSTRSTPSPTSQQQQGGYPLTRRMRSREKLLQAGDGSNSNSNYNNPSASASGTAGLSSGNSSNPGSSSSSSMTPATATMLVKLANPGTSPNAGERTLSSPTQESSLGGSSSNSRGGGGSSAVSKALSSAFSTGLDLDPPADYRDDRRRSPSSGQQNQQGQQYTSSSSSSSSSAQDSARHRSSPSSGTGTGGGGSSRKSTGPSNMNPNPSNSSSSGIAPSAFGRDSDDFVMIDEPSSAAYNSHTNNNSTNYNNNNSNNNNPTWKTSEAGAGGRDSGTSPSAHWYSGSPNTTGGTPLLTDPGVGGGGILTEMTSTQQQQQQLQQSNSEALQLSQCAHRCQYISSVVVAMTKHADSLVKTILAKHGKTISKEMDREAILGGGGAGAGGEGERDRDRDSPRQRSSTASSGGSDGYNIFSSSNQQLENNLQLLSEALCVPFSFYLHCMNYVQDAIQRTVSLKQQYQHQHQQTDSNMALHDNSPPSSSSPPPPSSSSYFLDQLDGLVSGLTQRFDQLMGRAEGCQRWIRADASPPPRPEPLIYQAALKMGQEAAVEELLGNLKLACAHYWDAKLLVECVLLSASEAGDRRVLQGYAKMFLDQFVVCEKSSALLDYDRGGGGSYSFEHKSQSLPPSPGSNSSFESHVSMNSNNNTPNQNTRNSPLLNNHYG